MEFPVTQRDVEVTNSNSRLRRRRVPPSPPRHALRDLWLLALVGGSLVVAGWLLRGSLLGVGLDDTGQTVAAFVVALTCRRVAATSPAAGRTWTLAGRAALFWGVGEAMLCFQHVALGSATRPSPADLAFAVAATYAIRAPLAFPTAPTAIASRSRLMLEGAAFASSVLFVTWVLVLIPYVEPGLSHAQLAVQLAYPLLDIVIISLVIATLARSAPEHALSLGAAALGVTTLAATNLTEACLAVIRGRTSLVSLWDLGFVVGLSLIGAGAAIDGVGAYRRLVDRAASMLKLLPYLPVPAVVGVVWTHRRHVPDGPMVLLLIFGLMMVARQLVLAVENGNLFREHRRTMEALAQSEQRYRRIVETAGEGMWVVDAAGVTQFVNKRVAEMLDMSEDDFVGRPALEVLDPLLDDEARTTLMTRMAERASGRSATYEFRATRLDGTALDVLISSTPLFDAAGCYEGSLTMISDITERKVLEDQLVEQARTDALTGLGNRTLLNAVSQSTLSRAGAALVYCDLDGFKAVNDSLGHSTGDVLLREVARRLRACLRPGDVIVRLGGDEFAALLPGVVAAAPAQAIADRMLEALRDPFPIVGRELYVTASIGIALNEPGAGVDALLRNADLAMYAAKTEGRGRHRVYEADMHSAITRRLQLEQDLRRALDAGELDVWFQPVMRLADSSCVGAEALVRWDHPEHGLLRPDEFIPVAEEAGLIADLERHVLSLATAEAARWAQADHPLTVSVNISPQHVMDGTVAADVAEALAVSGLPASRLLIELTERSLLAGGSAQAAVRALHALGCSIALDDFGTGFSSISHLRDFPVQILKLDRSFVAGMTSDLQAARLVHAILQLSETLGISCTAEGVETAGHARRLLAAGCSFAQGYLYAPALRPEEFAAWLDGAPAVPVPTQRRPPLSRDHGVSVAPGS
jgi:diguanylate cyclase (GGDEF)-like protein/PAS domain S-box-containing protein